MKVKQLEFKEIHGSIVCKTSVCSYKIQQYRGDIYAEYRGWTNLSGGGATSVEMAKYVTVDQAKKICQEHFNQLIMECME